ncbi:MAG TPA: FAD-dependent oxidoreductase [Candidatus Saccharimonadales bacterium]|nr:FAD-dependent oxidoreductase [Candidatus Saccharimonadales bacterium]
MKLKFLGKQKVIENVYSFTFEPSKKVKWQPGQYLHYELPHPDADDRGVERWFTISAPPYMGNIMLTTRFDTERSSTFKRALQKLEPGTQIEAGEPRGDFLLEPGAARHILIAGGIGVTPYHSMLLQLDHDNKPLNIDLFYANRDQNFVFDGEFQDLAARHPEFKIHKYIGNERIQKQDLEPFLAGKKNIFYVSGPRLMVEAYQHMLEDMGAEPERIKTDYFPGYKLG